MPRGLSWVGLESGIRALAVPLPRGRESRGRAVALLRLDLLGQKRHAGVFAGAHELVTFFLL